ncbi:MAG: hypothetical protein ACLRFM_00245 [Alphaproteobacteria bacterium]
MRRLPKKFYQGDTVSDPANQEPLKIMNKLLSEFRATIPDTSATSQFDKIHDKIIKQFLMSYPFKLRNMTDEFPFQLNMTIAITCANKKQKIKSKKIYNDLDTINKIAVKNIYAFVHKRKVIKQVG